MKLGQAIEQIRKDKNITQKDFADKCGISQTYLSQIEHGFKEPSFTFIESVRIGFGISLPVMLFLSIDESDVKQDKIEIYRVFKPVIDKLIKDIFLTTNEGISNE